MTFPDPYHEQYWHECPKHLQSPHLDPHSLHQTSLIICQNDPCTKCKCQDDISRLLSWTTLAWISQTSPKPSSGPSWPPPNITFYKSKWPLNKPSKATSIYIVALYLCWHTRPLKLSHTKNENIRNIWLHLRIIYIFMHVLFCSPVSILLCTHTKLQPFLDFWQ